MKRKELKTYKYDDIHFTSTKFLLKEEADQVMDAYEERIKELNKQLENAENAYYSLKMDMENRIKELEATISNLETPGWISVKDRMPPAKTYLLVAHNDGLVCHAFFRFCESRDDIGWTITHWMPLPPPPNN